DFCQSARPVAHRRPALDRCRHPARLRWPHRQRLPPAAPAFPDQEGQRSDRRSEQMVQQPQPAGALMRRLALAAALLAVVAMVVGCLVWYRPTTASGPSARLTRFAGTVKRQNGLPVRGASVHSLWIESDQEPRALGDAAADAAGLYHLDLRLAPGAEGVLLLMASAPGFETVGRQIDPTRRRQDVVLAEGAATAAVRVRDADGEPVAAAQVTLSLEPSAGEPGALTLFSAETGTDGRARFETLSLAAGTLHYSARAPGR